MNAFEFDPLSGNHLSPVAGALAFAHHSRPRLRARSSLNQDSLWYDFPPDRPAARGAGLAEFEQSLTMRSAIRKCRIASHRLRARKDGRPLCFCKRACNLRFHESLAFMVRSLTTTAGLSGSNHSASISIS